MTNNSLSEIVKKLKQSKSVAVFCHARPDGDALGAGLALCVALRNAGKTSTMFCEDLPPQKFSFIIPEGAVIRSISDKSEYDTFVSVDCADVARMGMFAEAYSKFSGTTINIDHHFSNNGYGKLNYVCNCPASCEVLTEILRAAGFEITNEIADLLMLGLITDSGNFTHCDVSEKPLKRLLTLGKAART